MIMFQAGYRDWSQNCLTEYFIHWSEIKLTYELYIATSVIFPVSYFVEIIELPALSVVKRISNVNELANPKAKRNFVRSNLPCSVTII